MFCSKRRPFAALSALGLTFITSLFSVDKATDGPRWQLPAALARSESAKPGAAPPVLPFLENDYAAARAKAVRSGKPLFVDVWALWCHTCLSMKNFVLTDPQLAPLAERMIYLAVDTEHPSSAAFVKRFPITSWPTFLVLDGEEKVLARWTGAMSAPELKTRLLAVLSQQAAQRPRLSEAEAQAAAGHPLEAARLYEEAMAEPGSRPQALLGLIQALRDLGQNERCVELYEQSFHQLGHSALATDFAAYTASCLDKISDVDRRQRLRRRLRGDLEHLLHEADADLSVDDRSDAYGTMIELSDAVGEKATGDRLASTRLLLLEKAAAAAQSPSVAATFDAHRFESYRRLQRWQLAEEMLLTSAKALPSDYNPPARLARLFYETGRIEEAERSIDLALSRCQGPRRVSMYELRASIQNSQGRTSAAIESLTSAISLYQANQPTSQAGVESARLRALREQVAVLQTKLREQPEAAEPSPAKSPPPPDKSNRSQPKRPTSRSPSEAKPPTPKTQPPTQYEPGMPVASIGADGQPVPRGKKPAERKKDRRVAHRDATIK